MSVSDCVRVLMGIDVEKAMVKQQCKSLLTLYKEGFYGEESFYKQSESHAHNLGEWINSRNMGLECQFAGEDYSHPERCKAFIGITIEELSSTDGLTYVKTLDESAISEKKSIVKKKLAENFDVYEDVEIYLLRHIE